MVANSLVDEGEVITWDQFPINEVFTHEGAIFAKMSAEDILRVRPTRSGGWIGYGETFKYDPSWNITLERLGAVETEELLQKELYNAWNPLALMFWATITLLGIIGFGIWLLSR